MAGGADPGRYAAHVSSPLSRAGLVERTASAVGVALLRRDLGTLGADEAAIADAAIRRGVRALPDTTLLGVRAAAGLCRALLRLHGHGDFLDSSPERQATTVEVLTRRPLPGVTEFVKLTRGLALVAVVDHRHRIGALG